MDDMSGVFVGAFVVIYLIALLISIGIAVVKTIAMWKLFEKAGEPGWKSLIPFYNFFEMTRLATGKYTIAIVYCVLIVPYMICYMLGSFMQAFSDGENAGVLATSLILVGVSMLALLAIYVLFAYINYKFAQSYGKSTGFCIAMIFLSTIMTVVMGFDRNTYYVGPNGIQEEKYY